MGLNDCGGGDYDDDIDDDADCGGGDNYGDNIDVDDKTRPGLQRCSDFSAASVPFLKSEKCEKEPLLRPIKMHNNQYVHFLARFSLQIPQKQLSKIFCDCGEVKIRI